MREWLDWMNPMPPMSAAKLKTHCMPSHDLTQLSMSLRANRSNQLSTSQNDQRDREAVVAQFYCQWLVGRIAQINEWRWMRDTKVCWVTAAQQNRCAELNTTLTLTLSPHTATLTHSLTATLKLTAYYAPHTDIRRQ